MGREKERQMKAEEDWGKVARAKGYTCSVCSGDIPYGEREVFFETGMCGWHAHTAKKAD